MTIKVGDQWIRPHRPHRPARGCARYPRHRDRRHQRPVEPDYMAYMLQLRHRARPLQGHDRRRGRHAGRQRQAHPPDARSKDPAELKWGELGADVVVESTGLFTTKEKAGDAPQGRREEGDHVRARRRTRRRCSCSASTTRATPGETIISNASCTTNCLAPLAKVLNDTWGIKRGLMTTVHAHDRDAEDRRRPVEQGLARRPRHPREHHPVVDRRGQGRRQGDSRTQRQAHRHVLPRADVRRVRRRSHRSRSRSLRRTRRSAPR